MEVAPVFTHHLSKGNGCYDADKLEPTDLAIEPTDIGVGKAFDEPPGIGLGKAPGIGSGKAFDDLEDGTTTRVVPVMSTDTPFFHLDLVSAVRIAEDAARR